MDVRFFAIAPRSVVRVRGGGRGNEERCVRNEDADA